MKVLKVFILGLLYGWLVKFTIDRIYRDHEIDDIKNENAFLKEHIQSLETRLKSKSHEEPSVKRNVTQPRPQSRSVQTATKRDDLKIIKGIGPAIEKKLKDAGINTFAEMARLTTGELESILGNSKRLQSAGNLITQAKKLAQQKR